jgi:hypothetical protein
MGVHHTLIDYGVSQSDELFYLFDPFTLYPGNVNQRLSAVDEAVSDTMIKTWVSFATTGYSIYSLYISLSSGSSLT